MEKELGQIKFTETDDGVRIDIKGKNLKELCACGCGMMAMAGKMKMADCCSDEEDKEENK
jgi:hypothetical protein